MSEPTPISVATLLARAAAVISGGVAEACYDPELARAIALTLMDGHKSEVLKIKRRFQDKFKRDFRTSHLDTLVQEEMDRLQTAAAGPAPKMEAWEHHLLRRGAKEDGSPGAVVMCEHNAGLYLDNHPVWKGVLGYNAFTASHAVLAQPPDLVHVAPGDNLKDHHDTEFTRWLQVVTGQAWSVDMVRRAVDVHARQNSFHPVMDYFKALPPWDGVERLKSWLFNYCGVGPGETEEALEEYPLDYISAVGERWMISAVARIFDAGCQVDHVLVLEGGEGLGKSTAVSILGNGWSGVLSGDVGSKDAQQMIASGVWIWEWAELASLRRSQVEQVKDFVTRRVEIYRPAFGRRVLHEPRKCVFVATVNGNDYLDRSDGKRRWWPVKCVRAFDLEGLQAAVPLLWAEALHKYKAGVPWHFDREKDKGLIETAKAEQAARVPEEVLLDAIELAARNLAECAFGPLYGSVSVPDLLAKLDVPLERRKGLQLEVTRCLMSSGWQLWQPRIKGRQLRRWRLKEEK